MRMSNLYFALFLTAILSGAATQTNAQANVIENQTNFIYVDAQAGSNGNSGAKLAPLKTIQAAINKANTLNEKGIGSKVIVNPGRRDSSTQSCGRSTAVTTNVEVGNPLALLLITAPTPNARSIEARRI